MPVVRGYEHRSRSPHKAERVSLVSVRLVRWDFGLGNGCADRRGGQVSNIDPWENLTDDQKTDLAEKVSEYVKMKIIDLLENSPFDSDMISKLDIVQELEFQAKHYR